jgi:Holliday junction resolvase RusA-like endonuclease
MEIHQLFVPGVPVPKGSAKAFMRKGAKFPVVVQDNAERQKPWTSIIGYTAQSCNVQKITGPVRIDLCFFMPRPKAHFRTGKNSGVLREDAPFYHRSKPDLDKLVRCVKDALTGIAWDDDSQVAIVEATKVYGPSSGVTITIIELDN